MPLCQRALGHIRSKLASYPSSNPFPILTEKQATNAAKFAQQRTPRTAKRNREAAVLVPLCNVGGEPSILFTLRSAHVSTHKNEISFPGGHSEEEDASFIDTALRETREELLGTYDFDSIDVLGVTGTVPSLTGSPVTPVIAVFTEDFDNEEHLQDIFQPPYSNSTDDNNSDNHDTREVEVVFRRSLAHLMQHETSQPLERLGTVGPVFPGPEGKIWGLTAVILRPLLHAVIIPAFREDA